MAQISSIAFTSLTPTYNCYRLGIQIGIRVTFSSNVDVSGPSSLLLNVLGSHNAAACTTSSQTGTTTLDYTYTVAAGDTTAGQILEVIGVDAVPDDITDSASGQPADLTIADGLEVPSGIDVTVNGDLPSLYITNVSTSATNGPANTEINIAFGCTERIINTDTPAENGTPAIQMYGSTAACVTTTSDGYTYSTVWTMTGSEAEAATVPMTIDCTTESGYALSSTLNLPIIVDKTAPRNPDTPAPSVSVSGDGNLTFSWDVLANVGTYPSAIGGYNYRIYRNDTLLTENTITFTDVAPTECTVELPSCINGSYTCSAQVFDKAGNTSDWSSQSATAVVDDVRPKCTITTAVTSPTNTAFDVSISFTNPETDAAMTTSTLSVDSIEVVNGSKGTLTLTDSVYTLRVVPSAAGPVHVRVIPEAVTATYNSQPNTESNTLEVEFDNVKPTCKLTGPSGFQSSSPLSYKLTFSKPVTGITVSSFTVTGATVTNVSGQGALWFAEVTPSVGNRPTTINVQVAAGAGVDAAGNTNVASNVMSVSYDDVVPSVGTVTSGEDISAGTIFGPGDKLQVKVTFTPDKPVIVKHIGDKPYLPIILTYNTSLTTVRRAYYKSGSSSNTLVFEYTVTKIDPASSIECQSIVLPTGSTIKDRYGNSANITISGTPLASSSLTIDPVATPLHASGATIANSVAIGTPSVSSTKLTDNVIQSGIGDGSDLLVSIEAAPNEKWLPKLRRGWFYYQDQEYYLFANKTTKTISAYTVANPIADLDAVTNTVTDEPAAVISTTQARIPRESVASITSVKINGVAITLNTVTLDKANATITFSSNTLAATDSVLVSYTYTELLKNGPVFVTGKIGEVSKKYVQVSSPLRVGEALTGGSQVAGTNNYSFAVSGIPVECYRKDLSYPMKRVPSVDAIQDVNEYCVLTELSGASIVYKVVVSGQSAAFVTYIPTSLTGVERVRQQELCVINSSMQVRAMYADLSSIANQSPVVRVIKDGVLTDVSMEAGLQGNVVTLPSTITGSDSKQVTLRPGDRVGISYFVNGCWTVDGEVLYAYTSDASTIDTLTIEYEGSSNENWETDSLPETSASYTQLNPLLDGIDSGFLYIVDDSTTVEKPTNLSLMISPGSVFVDNTTGNSLPVRIKVQALDHNQNPVHGEAIRVYSRGIAHTTKSSTLIDTITGLPQSINGAPISISGVGYYVNGVYKVCGSSTWSAAYTGDNWVITWTKDPPVTGTYLSVLYTPGLGKFADYGKYPENGATDWRGEYCVTWIPLHSGTTIIGASLHDRTPNLAKEAAVNQMDLEARRATVFTSSNRKIHLALLDSSDEPGTRKALAYVTDITGSYPVAGATVNWFSTSGRFKEAATLTNNDGVASNYYYLSGEDYIHATNYSYHSNRIHVGGAN